MFKSITGKLKAALYMGLSAALFLPAQAAQDLAESMRGLTEAGDAGVQLVFVVSALIGVALMIAGGIQLKKYADNPQQNGIAKPAIYILAGVIVFGVVATSETMEQTIFGGVDDRKGATLEGL